MDRIQSERISHHYPKIVQFIRKKGFFSSASISINFMGKIKHSDIPALSEKLKEDGIIHDNQKGWLCEVKTSRFAQITKAT